MLQSISLQMQDVKVKQGFAGSHLNYIYSCVRRNHLSAYQHMKGLLYMRLPTDEEVSLYLA